jgi:hypothetical protein
MPKYIPIYTHSIQMPISAPDYARMMLDGDTEGHTPRLGQLGSHGARGCYYVQDNSLIALAADFCWRRIMSPELLRALANIYPKLFEAFALIAFAEALSAGICEMRQQRTQTRRNMAQIALRPCAEEAGYADELTAEAPRNMRWRECR